MVDNKALYRRWRPQVFADLVGQNHVKQTIINAIREGHVSHAYLFAGPRGTGKTSLARLVAKAVNCLNPKDGEPCGKCLNCVALAEGRMIDLIEIDAASHTSVDDVRNLIEKVNYTPSVGKYKVYIIDEVHMLSKSAFNALLKTLEEPPAHAIFILATTEVHKLPATVISRCQYFDFHHFSHTELAEQLKKIAQQEKAQVSDEALRIIVDNAEGSMRDAISIMDQAVSFSGGKVDQHVLKDLLGIVDSRVVRELTQALIDKNALAGINLINDVYFKGYDLNQLGKLWLNYLRELLMIKLGNAQLVQKSADEKKIMAEQAAGFTVNGLINLLQRLVEAMNQYKVASLPQLALEMVIAKSCGEVIIESAPKPIEQKTPLSQPVPSSRHSGLLDRHSGEPLGRLQNLIYDPGRGQDDEVKKASSVQDDEVRDASSIQDNTNLKPSTLSAEDFASLKDKLCAGVSGISPSLGAVLKTCQIEQDQTTLVIKVPSKFLQDTLEKSTNRAIMQDQLTKAGISGWDIKLVVENGTINPVEAVAEVFGIM